VKLLIDTHLFLWAALNDRRFPRAAAKAFINPANELYISSASIWEVTIKSSRGDRGFLVDPRVIRRDLLDNGYIELPITSEHTLAVYDLPPIHKDPFDRILIAQATVEGITLLTSDRQVAKYPGPIRKV
jgi:PIN domain nuclease of toxin-antitoxin system